MKPTRKVTIFLASPSDVESEREEVKLVIARLNKTLGHWHSESVHIALKSWEMDVYSSAGRAQSVIFSQIGAYDIFLGIMWQRFGSPTGNSSSGTKEEFDQAYSLWKEKKLLHIAFYFCEDDISMPKTREQCEQLLAVVEFRQQLQSKMLIKTYKNIKSFSETVHDDLYRIISESITGTFLDQPSSDALGEDPESLIEMAYVLSDKGNVEGAILLLTKIINNYFDKLTHSKKARVMQLMAVQHRHRGELDSCIRYYAQAEIHLLQIALPKPSEKLIKFKVIAGRIMVEEYLTAGKCFHALTRYDELESDIMTYLNSVELKVDESRGFRNLLKHGQRQKAEMLRTCGQYLNALEAFTNAYDEYSYASAAEKAYSALGQADCLRLLRSLSQAHDKYKEVEDFALSKNDLRLLARVKRNQLFLHLECDSDSSVVQQDLSDLESLSKQSSLGYRYGVFYATLISGIIELTKNPKESIKIFNHAIDQVSPGHGCLGVESIHARFYLAESLRLSKRLSDAEEHYAEALQLYSNADINWGVIRSRIALVLTNDNQRTMNSLNSRHLEGADRFILEKYRAGNIHINSILGTNLV